MCLASTSRAEIHPDACSRRTLALALTHTHTHTQPQVVPAGRCSRVAFREGGPVKCVCLTHDKAAFLPQTQCVIHTQPRLGVGWGS